ncbi:hypothetical protein ACJMK2_001744 [Sinanodonta woodiana]|uniref:Uncharacterized protein n=1 Tax=Sinanodonta woodiana TaxID=1069815 RepID=A0ABD3XT93_SINWO
MNWQDAVRLSQDLYEKGCNLSNIFLQLGLPVFSVCDTKLLMNGNGLQVKYNHPQKRYVRSDMPAFRNGKNPKRYPWSRASANTTAANTMSGPCTLPSFTMKLGYVYGNCSGLYQDDGSEICLGACGKSDPRILVPWRICRRTQAKRSVRWHLGDETNDHNIMPM